MGLDTTHDCWNGAYSAFNRWREKIAQAAGVPLPLMKGFYSLSEYETAAIDGSRQKVSVFQPAPGGGMMANRDTLTAALEDSTRRGNAGVLADTLGKITPWLPLKWESLKPDPIHVLLNHSDCDGHIDAKDCAALADRLESLMPLLDDDGGCWGHVGSYRGKAQQFIDGLRKAHEAKQNVEFH